MYPIVVIVNCYVNVPRLYHTYKLTPIFNFTYPNSSPNTCLNRCNKVQNVTQRDAKNLYSNKIWRFYGKCIGWGLDYESYLKAGKVFFIRRLDYDFPQSYPKARENIWVSGLNLSALDTCGQR